MTNFEQIVFVHIPRTGGNSIRESLKSYFSTFEVEFLSGHKYYDNFEHKENSYSFSFVRNPYNHLISFYNYHKGALNLKEYRKINFKEWVKAGFPNHWKSLPGFPDDPITQHKYIIKGGKIQVDFLGKFEKIEEEFTNLRETLEIPEQELAKWTGNDNRLTSKYNTFKGKIVKNRFKDYYDAETIQIVNRVLHEDFQYFGYPKIED